MTFVIYILLCIFIGILSRKMTFGFWGFFFVAFFFTPITGFLIYLISRPDDNYA